MVIQPFQSLRNIFTMVKGQIFFQSALQSPA